MSALATIAAVLIGSALIGIGWGLAVWWFLTCPDKRFSKGGRRHG